MKVSCLRWVAALPCQAPFLGKIKEFWSTKSSRSRQVQQLRDALKGEDRRTKQDLKDLFGVFLLFLQILLSPHLPMPVKKCIESINLEISRDVSKQRLSFKNISTKIQDLVLIKTLSISKINKIKNHKAKEVSWTASSPNLTDSNLTPISNQWTPLYKLALVSTTQHQSKSTSESPSLIQKESSPYLLTRRTP